MPIRLNLLAEAQAAEELRRRDPVKRAIWICALVIGLVVVGAGFLQWKIMDENRTLAKQQSDLSSQTNQFVQIIDSQKKLMDISQRLTALKQLAANRFLWGNLLDTLQQTTVDDIQLLRLLSEQKYALTPEVKGKTNDLGKVNGYMAATIAEKIILTLEVKDTSSKPGSTNMNKFKENLAASPFLKELLGKTNEILLKGISQPQIDPELGRPSITFRLESSFPEKTR